MNRYIYVENNEAFSIALMAFDEAMAAYDIHKGSFLSFAKLVIGRRLSNFEARQSHHLHDNIDDYELSEQAESLDNQVI